MKENEITRREAVERVGAVGAAGVLLTTPSLASVPIYDQEKSTRLEHNADVHKMGCEDWKKLVGENFEITGHAFVPDKKFKKTKAKLVVVDDHRHESDRNRPKEIRECGFSLVFTTPVGTDLDCKTHVIVHDKLGTCHYHLQRVHHGKDHVEVAKNKKKNEFYEVVIN